MKKILIIFFIIIFIFSCNKNQTKNKNEKLTKKDIPQLIDSIEQKIKNKKNEAKKNYWIISENGVELRNINNHKKITIIPYSEKITLIEEGDSYTDVDGIIDKWDIIEWNGKKGLILSYYIGHKKPDKLFKKGLIGRWINEKESYYIEFKEDSIFLTNKNVKEIDAKRKWEYIRFKQLIKINNDDKENVIQLYYVNSINHYQNGFIKELSLLDLNNGGIKKFTCNTTPIHDAVKKNDLEKFKKLTPSNDDFMIEAAYGIRPIHLAAKNGNMEIIDYMNNRSDYSYLFKNRTAHNESMFHFAVLGGHINIIDFLIRKDLDINESDNGGYTPLHYAIMLGNKDLVIKLIEEGADIAKTNRDGMNSAQISVLYNQPEILNTLLYYGVNPEYSNYKVHDSLLHMCFYLYKKNKENKKEYKNPELPEIQSFNENDIINMFKILMDKSIEINIKNKDDQTILHYAAMGASKSILNKILEFDTDYKLDIDAVDDDDFTPLHYASIYNNIEAAQFLIGKGANVNPSKGYETPLWVAVDNTNDAIADLLVKNGADLLHTYYDEKSLLHKAAYYNNLKVIKGLVKRGADINYKDNNGDTPLHYAIKENKTDAVKTLLELKIDVNVKNKEGNTPLHTASLEYKEEILKLVIEYYKDVNIKNKDGNTPLHLAAGKGRGSHVKILLNAGAELNIKNNEGQDVREFVESSRLYGDKKRKMQKMIRDELMKREQK